MPVKRAAVPLWLWLSLLTALLWGVWGVQARIAADRMGALTNQMLFVLGFAPLVLVCLLRLPGVRAQEKPGRWGGVHAFVTGLLGGGGNVTFILALRSGGPTSTVVALTSLSPLVTVGLAAWLLREPAGPTQRMGIGLALVSIVLLSV